jgi:putative addiction module component (TIGR02574 family)
MEQKQIEKLHNLSRKEKFEIVQFLWDDIAKEQEELAIPYDHQKIINERIERIKTGKSTFKTWDEIKTKYMSA